MPIMELNRTTHGKAFCFARFELSEADDERHHQIRQYRHLHQADVDIGDRLQDRSRFPEEQPDEYSEHQPGSCRAGQPVSAGACGPGNTIGSVDDRLRARQ
jgi:hypothetical protein